jgi:uncharacterized membrane protein (DUF2068 family)
MQVVGRALLLTYAKKPRPLSITALAILDVVGAAVSVLLGFSLLSDMQAYIQMLINFDSSYASMGTDVLALAVQLVSAFVTVTGLLALLDAYGLCKGKSWAWWMSLLLSLMGALLSVFILPTGMVSLAIELLILYYLTRGQVRDYFKPVAESLTTASA